MIRPQLTQLLATQLWWSPHEGSHAEYARRHDTHKVLSDPKLSNASAGITDSMLLRFMSLTKTCVAGSRNRYDFYVRHGVEILAACQHAAAFVYNPASELCASLHIVQIRVYGGGGVNEGRADERV